jgi:hypothetical protein
MIVTVKAVGSGVVLGKVKLDPSGKVVEGDDVAGRVVTDVLYRFDGDTAALNGWTNGYVQLKAA